MLHDVGGDRVEAVVPRNQMVALAQELLEPRLALVVEACLVDDLVEVVVEVRVGEGELGVPVLVKERISCFRRSISEPRASDAEFAITKPARPLLLNAA